MENIKAKIPKEVSSKNGIILLIAIAAVVSTTIFALNRFASINPLDIFWVSIPEFEPSEFQDFKPFESELEFKAYLEQSNALSYGFSGWASPARTLMAEESVDFSQNAKAPVSADDIGMGGGEPEPDRVSETNVQVIGIDEPDIVKTDGKEIYASLPQLYRYIMPEPGMPYQTGGTKAIRAFPPADLEVESEIEKTGNLLLDNDTLVVLSGNEVTGYDVSDPASPEQKWWIKLEKNNYLQDARLMNSKIYLITRQRINNIRPCPIKPMLVDGEALEIRCTDIYRPGINMSVDTTYTTSIIDAASGKLETSISFVGSSDSSVIYMSPDFIYATYLYYQDPVEFVFDFFSQTAQDIIPDDVLVRIKKLAGYDISQTAKMTELSVIIEQFQSSLDDDERMRIENELTNRMEGYYEENKRELQKTGIVKISTTALTVAHLGDVPGALLNQFSLDEFEDNLRVATTIGRSWGFWGGVGQSESDVYVLNKALKEVGSVKGLGEGERIYSVRFIADKGYLVTFKQIDPFFVLDLSVPENPEVKGELKIPGYSSYLHPIDDEQILGIGKEGSNVKLSLFNVADPSNPIESAKYILNEYWSDVLNTHHAFLLDSKHSVFFLPGSRGGYIFSYDSGSMKLERAVSNINARRAIYINDYLYIIGDNSIVVLNELDWQKVNELDL